MTRFMIAAAATLSLLIAVPSVAQDAASPPAAAGSLSADQQAIYNRWAAPARTAFDAWPESQRTYFWTLTPPQRRIYWRLSDDQRAQLDAKSPEERAAAWPAITAAARRASPRRGGHRGPVIVAPTVFVKGELPPPPPEALNRDYPVCSKTIQDKCINRGAVGRR